MGSTAPAKVKTRRWFQIFMAFNPIDKQWTFMREMSDFCQRILGEVTSMKDPPKLHSCTLSGPKALDDELNTVSWGLGANTCSLEVHRCTTVL